MKLRKGCSVEVFDVSTWKAGKIMKVLKNNHFVLRLYNSIEFKVFHISNIRVQQSRRSSIEKPSKRNGIDNRSRCRTHVDSEENTECSVASCSSMCRNIEKYTYQSPAKFNKCKDISDDLDGKSVNTASSCAPKAETNGIIRELELHAYRSTLQALYASGPLSWEQESLLTNLRISLHISNEEHLIQIRDLLSA